MRSSYLTAHRSQLIVIIQVQTTMNSKNNTSSGRGSTSQNPHTPSRASNRKTHQNSRARIPARSKSQGGGQPSVPMSGVPFGYVPAFLPGSASLVEQLDRRIMVVLRDGRHLVGVSLTNVNCYKYVLTVIL